MTGVSVTPGASVAQSGDSARRWSLTHDSQVEGSLPHAIVVPDLNSVAATVLLLATFYGKLTAGICALNGEVTFPLLNL